MSEKKAKYVIPGPKEHDGWSCGQVVWCKLYPNNELAAGKIMSINLNDSEPCFTLADDFTDSIRLSLFSSIIPVPTATMQNKLEKIKAKDAAKVKKFKDEQDARARKKRGR